MKIIVDDFTFREYRVFMLAANSEKASLKRAVRRNRTERRVKYRGIVADAKALNVHRIYLWLVLTGRRRSTRLMNRYQELKGGK